MAELATLFLSEGPRLVANVHKAIVRKDATAIQSAAHALAGSSRSMAATPLADAARRLEAMAQAGDLSMAATAGATLDDELARLTSALSAIVNATEALQREPALRRAR